ncbi:MAG: hypothetical protein KIT84_25320 [Labilithrix sp.]|nr:hypothetical protein [Labilithrix sp.]MCW5814372.1 hypothetical protein [Labilithrix sp.]
MSDAKRTGRGGAGLVLAVMGGAFLLACDIEKDLTTKYGRPPATKTPSHCALTQKGVRVTATEHATIRSWTLPGLHVVYSPFGGPATCDTGIVRIETAAYRQMGDAAARESDAKRPRL